MKIASAFAAQAVAAASAVGLSLIAGTKDHILGQLEARLGKLFGATHEERIAQAQRRALAARLDAAELAREEAAAAKKSPAASRSADFSPARRKPAKKKAAKRKAAKKR